MKEFIFEDNLWVPRPLGDVFQFFSDAFNLQAITPPWVNFEVLTPAPIRLQAGTLIDYRIRIRGVPVKWRTEIAEWDPPHRFVDVQLRGPYRLWHHTHGFKEHDGGTLCTDRVRYHPWGGVWVDRLFVRRDVKRIFEYRKLRLASLLGPE